VVSKNDLPLISGSPVKFETSGEWAPEFSQSFDRFFPRAITGNLEFPGACYPHFDLVTFLQLQGIDHSRGQPHRKTIPPL
jgi:hypothetical protein